MCKYLDFLLRNTEASIFFARFKFFLGFFKRFSLFTDKYENMEVFFLLFFIEKYEISRFLLYFSFLLSNM